LDSTPSKSAALLQVDLLREEQKHQGVKLHGAVLAPKPAKKPTIQRLKLSTNCRFHPRPKPILKLYEVFLSNRLATSGPRGQHRKWAVLTMSEIGTQA